MLQIISSDSSKNVDKIYHPVVKSTSDIVKFISNCKDALKMGIPHLYISAFTAIVRHTGIIYRGR